MSTIIAPPWKMPEVYASTMFPLSSEEIALLDRINRSTDRQLIELLRLHCTDRTVRNRRKRAGFNKYASDHYVRMGRRA